MAKNRIANYTNEGKTISTSILVSVPVVLHAAYAVLGTTTIWSSGADGSKITSVKISKTGSVQANFGVETSWFLILRTGSTSYILKKTTVATAGDLTAGLTTLLTSWDASFAALTDANGNKYLNVPTSYSIDISLVMGSSSVADNLDYGNATIYHDHSTIVTVTSENY